MSHKNRLVCPSLAFSCWPLKLKKKLLWTLYKIETEGVGENSDSESFVYHLKKLKLFIETNRKWS